MEEVDKECPMIRIGVSGGCFFLVPAYPGSLGQRAVKRLCVCVCVCVCVVIVMHANEQPMRLRRSNARPIYSRTVHTTTYTRA